MIEIKEDKFEKMAEYTEKMLKYGGKLMSCLSEVGEQHGMSFRDDEMYREPREVNERYPYGVAISIIVMMTITMKMK